MNESSTDTKSIQERWLRPVNRFGTVSILLCIIATFLPSLYLNWRYDAFIGWNAVGAAFTMIIAVFGVNWFIEPVTYYPMLGNAGTYMSWLAGSCAQQRVPAAVVAKDAMEVKEGTQEAEVVSVVAIAGSIVTNIVVLTLTCFIGTWIISILPAVVLNGIATYLLPAMFGAMLAMFGSSQPILTIPTFVIMIALNALSNAKIISIKAYILIIISIVGCICYARVLYKLGIIGKKKTA